MKKNVYFILISLIFFARQTTAQTLQVLDSVKTTAVEYATVIVLNANKDSILQQGHTDLKGQFLINSSTQKRAFISVTMIGYKKSVVPYQQQQITIRMVPNTIGLHDVTIRAIADPMKFSGNKIEYDISQIAHAEYLNTAQILDRLPFLEIQDNRLKMMNEPITIYIDGKPNPIYSTVDGLRSLPPQAIEKVELSLVPSARANGAKVLNIILRRDFYLGFNGSMDGTASLYHGNVNTSSTYWRKTFGIDAIADYTSGSSRVERSLIQNNLTDHTQLTSESVSKTNLNNGGLSVSGFYNVSKSGVFDMQFSLHNGNSDTHIFTTTQTGSTNQNTELDNHQPSGTPVNLSLNFTQKLAKEGDKFYILTNLSSSLPTRFYTLANSGSANTGLQNQTYNNHNDNKERTLELILEKNSGKVFKYTLGSKVISRYNSSRTLLQADSTAGITDFNVRQFVNSSYMDADLIIKKFTLHTALRLDYNANLFSTPDDASQHFINFVPTATLSYNKSRKGVFLFSYSRSLQRPGLYQYQPVPIATGAYGQTDGNVNLRNELNNTMTLSYLGNYKFARLAVNFGFTDISGFLNDLITVDSNQVAHRTPVNVDAYTSYTLGFSINFGLFKKFRLSHTSSGSLLRQRIADHTINNWSGYLSDKLYYEVSKKSEFGAEIRAFSANLIPYGKFQVMDYFRLNLNYGYFFDLSAQLPASLGITLTNPNLPHGTRGYEYVSNPALNSQNNWTTRNAIAIINFRVAFKGKTFGNRTFNKSKSIQNSDLKDQ